MPISEEKAFEILQELIKKPESKAEDLARIWSQLIDVYNQNFSPTSEETKKKRRRKRVSGSPNLGWPAGVSRAEYKLWKQAQEAQGFTENINPQEYRRLKDAGALDNPLLGSAK
jgi:hypothetical protein